MNPIRRPYRTSRAGVTLLELIVVMTLLLVSTSILSSMIVPVSRQREINSDNAIAADAARSVLETMRAQPFDEIFARYNADAADDPVDVDPIPGAGFAVPGLELQPGDPDGLAGRVELPMIGAELREDVDDAALGMPRDLDADLRVDASDHANDYRILPVRVLVEWQGRSGPRRFELCTALTELRF